MNARRELSKLTLDELTDRSANVSEGSNGWPAYRAEFMRRQTKAQISAAWWMAASVIVLAVSSVINLIVTVAQSHQ